MTAAFKTHLKELARALRGLAPEQGRIARRNARARVARALKRILVGMNADFPTIRKESTKPRRRRTPAEQTNALHARDYVPASTSVIAVCARIGVRVESVKHSSAGRAFYVPRWVRDLAPTTGDSRLRELARSKTKRDAALVAAALRKQGG